MAPVWRDVPARSAALELLAGAVDAPVHAYLLVGPPGSGRREAARAFAAALLCPAGGDGTCRNCRLALAGAHPDVVEVVRVGASISAEQADDIVRLAALAPVEGRRKLLVLDEFHLLRPEAAAKLLKTIEEPTASTVFIVLADQITIDLVTIASRCVRVDFAPLSEAAIGERLEADGIDPQVAAGAAALADGDLDRARLLALDPAAAERIATFSGVPGRIDGTGAVVARIVDELVTAIDAAAAPLRTRQADEARQLDERQRLLGGRKDAAARKALDERHRRELRRHRIDEWRAGLRAIAATYRDRLAEGTARDPASAVAAVGTVHDALEALDRNPNEVLLLQALLLRLPGL